MSRNIEINDSLSLFLDDENRPSCRMYFVNKEGRMGPALNLIEQDMVRDFLGLLERKYKTGEMKNV